MTWINIKWPTKWSDHCHIWMWCVPRRKKPDGPIHHLDWEDTEVTAETQRIISPYAGTYLYIFMDAASQASLIFQHCTVTIYYTEYATPSNLRNKRYYSTTTINIKSNLNFLGQKTISHTTKGLAELIFDFDLFYLLDRHNAHFEHTLKKM